MKPSQESHFCQLKQPNPANLSLCIQDDDSEIVVPLGKNFYSIGRDPDQDICLSNQGISRYHASLILLNNSYHIVDGDPSGSPSKNGILVNGKGTRKQTLAAGDKIAFCQRVYAEVVARASDEINKSSTAMGAAHVKASMARAIHLSCNVQSSSDLFYGFPDLIIKLDVDGHILGFQNAVDEDLPKLSSQHLNRSISECFSINFAINLFKCIRQVEKTQAPQEFESSFCVNSNFLFCEVRVFLGSNDHKIAVVRNICERKRLEQKLLIQAAHDSLTGLPNRSFFMDKTAYSVSLKQKNKSYNYAVFFVDLDRFKIINDSLGHLAGDRLLIEISMRLKDCLRPQDTVARLGGDEFAILLHDIKSIDDAIDVAERLQSTLAVPLILENREIFPSASIGIAFSKTTYNCVEDIIKDADIAMYKSKSAGRARYTIFEHEDDSQLLSFLQLDSSLKRAIERQEFMLYYQPIFELKTQKMIGLEALIRWDHPQEGLLEPQHFLEQAEETGLTAVIGKWILQQACCLLNKWEHGLAHDFPMFLSINISKCQFYSSDFIAVIEQLINRYHVSVHRLKLEIAEATIMADIQASMVTLKSLENLGIKILIDDFGVSYSSLNYLNNFPLDALKIDPSFIDGMDNDATSTGFTIIQSIIGLAHSLGVEVIAEGVECARHVAWLRSFNCDYGQGFYFGKPMSEQEIMPFIEAELEAWCISHLR